MSLQNSELVKSAIAYAEDRIAKGINVAHYQEVLRKLRAIK